jgi:hypothetical protein
MGTTYLAVGDMVTVILGEAIQTGSSVSGTTSPANST